MSSSLVQKTPGYNDALCRFDLEKLANESLEATAAASFVFYSQGRRLPRFARGEVHEKTQKANATAST
jgi:hypothetical protein